MLSPTLLRLSKAPLRGESPFHLTIPEQLLQAYKNIPFQPVVTMGRSVGKSICHVGSPKNERRVAMNPILGAPYGMEHQPVIIGCDYASIEERFYAAMLVYGDNLVPLGANRGGDGFLA
ncbi:MAG: hypothetical protein WC869_00990 [Phycisphaerae bacterium]|jgi:hypothetical protein